MPFGAFASTARPSSSAAATVSRSPSRTAFSIVSRLESSRGGCAAPDRGPRRSIAGPKTNVAAIRRKTACESGIGGRAVIVA